MGEALAVPLLLPYVIGAVLSSIMELAITPRPSAPWRRPATTVLLHLGAWTLAFGVALALFRRPYFAVANALTAWLVVILVNNAKFHSLRESFVYQDFEYFTDAIKHPRLYLPFFGLWRLLGAIGAYGCVLWLGLTLEPSLTASEGGFGKGNLPTFLVFCLAVSCAGFLIARVAARRMPEPAYDASKDLHRLGFVSALWRYSVDEKRPIRVEAKPPFSDAVAHPSARGAEDLPDLVVVQGESFFDARALYPHIKTGILGRYDALRAQARRQGKLHVPAWGANTIRTEFSFLSGIASHDLGVHKYQPYRYLAFSGIPTIASCLKAAGYRTICVHPYHSSFYNRNKLFPIMGFDEFLDIREFIDAERAGPYVSDVALAEYVGELLRRERSYPIYVHVITMENHGPLHWEQVNAADREAVLNRDLPAGCDDLVAYARHLGNTDAMLALLSDTLRASPRPSGLCMFGDHVPIMPEVYRQLGAPAGPTNYLIWSPQAGDGHGSAVDMDASELSGAFLRIMGIL